MTNDPRVRAEAVVRLRQRLEERKAGADRAARHSMEPIAAQLEHATLTVSYLDLEAALTASPPAPEAAGCALAERREKALRDGYDQIAHHAHQIELIIKRGALAAFEDAPEAAGAEALPAGVDATRELATFREAVEHVSGSDVAAAFVGGVAIVSRRHLEHLRQDAADADLDPAGLVMSALDAATNRLEAAGYKPDIESAEPGEALLAYLEGVRDGMPDGPALSAPEQDERDKEFDELCELKKNDRLAPPMSTNDTPAQSGVEAARDRMARKLYETFLHATNRGSGRIDLSGININEWFDTNASMPLSGPPFVELWNSMADAALSQPSTVGAEDEAGPVAWHCVGSGEGWSEDKIIRHRESAERYAECPDQWHVRPLVYATRPARAADGQRVKDLTERLGGYAITEEYDFPGDAPEFCGYRCHECKEHVEADGSGHGADCLCHGVAPNTPRAKEKRASLASEKEG